ncbi:MAG: sulfatase-like hydrolase/transferase, partial [Fuerstiella sp.]
MKHLVLILAINIVLFCGSSSTKAAAAVPAANTTAPPNFVVIFTDDQGYQDVGCFGSPDIRTPRLDTMASQGM